MADKVILFVADGLGYETAITEFGYLESLVAGGKARRWRMRAVLPTISVPIYETLHSGTEPHEHGITTNGGVRLSTSEHVFAVARRHGRSTAAVAHSDFSRLYNAMPYQPLRDQEVNDSERTIQYGRFYMQKSKSRAHLGLASEADLMMQAAILVERYAPGYLLIHSMSCDSIGHLYGATAPEYRKQAGVVDEQLAEHVAAWRDSGYRVLVTADHGMSEIGHHGGTRDDIRHVPFYDIGHDRPGQAEEDACQLAVAPSVLAILDLPIPAVMQAQPLD